MTQCTPRQLEFSTVGRRRIVAQFDGGAISSDAGALLLKEVEARTGLLAGAARCFTDHRQPERVEHRVEELVAQRVMGLALGYEDLNDHDELRHDALFAAVVGKVEAVAGNSTLNRLELTRADASAASRYKKIVADEAALDALFVEQFVAAHRRAPKRVVLDLDATDDPLHGRQEGRFFHGYYRCYCYLPLYIFAGEHLLCARLRSADADGAAGAVEELARIVGQLRQTWPSVQVIVRADSGFCREALMAWCEANAVDYVLGLAKNSRLLERITAEQEEAAELHRLTGEATRVFAEFGYRTRKSWSRTRRVVAKAEHLSKGANPRFVVTSLAATDYSARVLYEKLYCARGEMENHIKEQQLALFADRTSAATMRANQLRLYFSSLAYCLLHALRRLALAGTALANAQCDTIRLRLLKLGARVRVSVRKVWVSLSQSYPHAQLFEHAWRVLRAPP